MSVHRLLTAVLGGGSGKEVARSLAGSRAGRRFVGRAEPYDWRAALGGVGCVAWYRYRLAEARAVAPGPAPQPPDLDRFLPPDPREREVLDRAVLQALVAGAHADGRLGWQECSALCGLGRSLELTDAEQAELVSLLEEPADPAGIAAATRSLEMASVVFAASLLSVEVDTPGKRAYLATLASTLGLPDALVAAIHRELGIELAPHAPRNAVQETAILRGTSA